jgi:porphobilinogen deaminase
VKDVPTSIPPGLQISAVPEREDARDAFIAKNAHTLSELPAGSLVGTGSIRRQAQLLALRPDLRVADIRGNVDSMVLQEDASIPSSSPAGLSHLGPMTESLRRRFAQMPPLPVGPAMKFARRCPSHQSHIINAHRDAVTAERHFCRGRRCRSCRVYAQLSGTR